MKESGKRGSNPRPLAWEANALPTELLPLVILKLKKNFHCLARQNFVLIFFSFLSCTCDIHSRKFIQAIFPLMKFCLLTAIFI